MRTHFAKTPRRLTGVRMQDGDLAHTRARSGRVGAGVSQTLRSRLFMLAAVGLLPLAVAAAVGTAYLVKAEIESAQKASLELSRALATAVNSELKSTIAVLQVLSLSRNLASPDLAAFHAETRQVAIQRKWRAVLLADRYGNIVSNSHVNFGQDIPAPIEPASLLRVSAMPAPLIGHVAVGPRGPSFAARVPVMRDGQLAYVLSAVVSSAGFSRL